MIGWLIIIGVLLAIGAVRYMIDNSPLNNPPKGAKYFNKKTNKYLGENETKYVDAMVKMQEFTQGVGKEAYEFVFKVGKFVESMDWDIQNSSQDAADLTNFLADRIADGEIDGGLIGNVAVYMTMNHNIQDMEIAMGVPHNPNLIQDSAVSELIVNAMKCFMNDQRAIV